MTCNTAAPLTPSSPQSTSGRRKQGKLLTRSSTTSNDGMTMNALSPLMPAKAGIQGYARDWVPAFAGTSETRSCQTTGERAPSTLIAVPVT